MQALVFGATGQVGRELILAADRRGHVATALGRAEVDLTDLAACAQAIAASETDLVINAAAYTAVDRAESEPELAEAINAAAPRAMARACAERGLPFLHISTDYVFDGTSTRPWREDDPTGPLGVYGRTKRAGELAVIGAGGAHVILRTAWVFSAHGGNFVKTMLRAGHGRSEMRVVGDQWGGPTAARDIAVALWSIAERWREGRGMPGIFHFAGAPATTWAGFAEAVFARCGWAEVPKVTAIDTADWPTPVRRPANSVLDCTAIAQAYGIGQPDWRAGLDAVIRQLEETR